MDCCRNIEAYNYLGPWVVDGIMERESESESEIVVLLCDSGSGGGGMIGATSIC